MNALDRAEAQARWLAVECGDISDRWVSYLHQVLEPKPWFWDGVQAAERMAGGL